jgi:hypothetical protein
VLQKKEKEEKEREKENKRKRTNVPLWEVSQGAIVELDYSPLPFFIPS